jgi:prephenate dehydrogenase
MTPRLEVVGLGLMGLSLAWRLQAAGWDVWGVDVDAEAVAWAESLGIRAGPAPDADWTVLAVPLSALPTAVDEVARRARPGRLVTDLTSVKGPVLPLMAALPRTLRVISSHPMAGSESGGYRAARPDLYTGRLWAAVPVPGHEPPWDALAQLVAPLGARITRIDGAEHDRVAAFTSHLPYVVSLMLSQTALEGPAGLERLVGPAFQSATRTAASPPGLWSEILAANRDAVLTALETLAEEMGRWQTLLREADRGELEEAIRRARDARERWLTPSD